MSAEEIAVRTIRHDRVLIIGLDRPAKRNAINAASLPQAANARVTLMQMAISYLLAATWQARTAIARDARYRIPRVELDN